MSGTIELMRTSVGWWLSVVTWLAFALGTGCSDNSTQQVQVSLSGALEKGPFVLGSSVKIATLDQTLNPSGELFSTQTVDDTGRFSIDFDQASSQAVSIEGSGFYYNEISGALSSAPITLLALDETNASGTHVAFVNVVTHIAYQRAKTLAGQGMSITNAELIAEAELRAQLHVGPASFDPGASGLEMTILGGDTDPNAYLLAVSAVLAQAAVDRGGPTDAVLQEFLNTLALELADDGAFSTSSVDAMLTAQQALDPDLVMTQLADRISAIGSSAVVPNINRLIDSDLDGLVNSSDNCRRGANLDQSDLDGDGVGDVCDDDATLVGLVPSVGTLSPEFSSDTTDYEVNVDLSVPGFSVTPTASDIGATIRVNGALVASGTPSPSIALNPGPNPVTVAVTAQDGVTVRTYTLVANRGAQRTYLKASNTAAIDFFGRGIAMSGDTLVVGAPFQGNGGNISLGVGAVYVFVRNGDTWTQQAFLQASNAEAGDAFGQSVSISGDTLVVGALGESSNAVGVNGDETNNAAARSGAVYIFVRSGTTWTQQAYIKSSNTEAGDGFGESVSISGDALVVGARNEDSAAVGVDGNQASNTASSAGAAYVFTRNGAVWSQQAYLKASNTAASAEFGFQVASSGDTVAVSAISEGGQSGAVYVFTRSGTVWSQQAFVKASNGDPGDIFGVSLSLDGDTMAVGAQSEDSNAVGVNGNESSNGANDSGAVYVFTRAGTSWTQQAYLKASNTGAGDNFGTSVSVSGDLLAVGAPHEDSGAVGVNGNQADESALSSGAAYVFARSGTAWNQQAYLKASNAESNDGFGNDSGVCVSGSTIVVAALGEDSNAPGIDGDQTDNSATSSGALYVFQ